MLDHQVNPLDDLIATISRSRHLLTSEHLKFFRELLPRDKANPIVNEKSTINDLLGTLTTIAANLKTTAAGTNDIDGYKVLIGAIEKVMGMVNKYTEQVSQEEKYKTVQDTIMEALSETSEELKDRFLAIWAAKIDALER